MTIALKKAKFSFLIIRKQFKKSTLYSENIKKYRQRYLRNSYYKRINTFLKMLGQIPANGLNKKLIIAKTKKLYEILKTTPRDPFYLPIEIEIIPYEHLWAFLISGLSERHY